MMKKTKPTKKPKQKPGSRKKAPRKPVLNDRSKKQNPLLAGWTPPEIVNLHFPFLIAGKNLSGAVFPVSIYGKDEADAIREYNFRYGPTGFHAEVPGEAAPVPIPEDRPSNVAVRKRTRAGRGVAA